MRPGLFGDGCGRVRQCGRAAQGRARKGCTGDGAAGGADGHARRL